MSAWRRSTELLTPLERLLQQWKVGSTRQIEVCRALRNRPALGSRAARPVFSRDVDHKLVKACLCRIELLDDRLKLGMHLPPPRRYWAVAALRCAVDQPGMPVGSPSLGSEVK